jgi:hypothetical protein
MPFPTYAKKEDIPAGFEDAYTEQNGEFVFVNPLAKDVEKLTGTVGTLRDVEKDLKAKLRQAEEAEAAQRRRADSPEGGEKWEERVARWEADVYEKRIKPLEEKVAALGGENRTLRLDDKVKAIIADAEAGVLPKHRDKLWKLYHDRFDLAEDGSIVVKDAEGKLLPTKPLEFVTSLRDAEDWAFQANPASGSGASAATGAPSVGGAYIGGFTKEQFHALPPNARMDLIQKHGDPATKKAAA